MESYCVASNSNSSFSKVKAAQTSECLHSVRGRTLSSFSSSPLSVDNSSQFGTLTTVTGKSTGLDSWLVLPDWLEEGTESTLRDSPEEYPTRPATSFSSSSHAGPAGTGSQAREILRPTVSETRASSYAQSSGSQTKKQWANLNDFLDEAPESESSESSSDEVSDEQEQHSIENGQNTSAPSREVGNILNTDEEEGTSSSDGDESSE